MSKYTRCPRCSEYVGQAADLQTALGEAQKALAHATRSYEGASNRADSWRYKCETAETALARAEEERDACRDLLARVHRDGGHRQQEVGVARAAREAEDRVAHMLENCDSLARLAHERGEALRRIKARVNDGRENYRKYIRDEAGAQTDFNGFCVGIEYLVDAALADSRTSPVTARLAAAEKLVEALRYIARPGYGLQGLVEDDAPEAEHTKYWARKCDRLQAKAREALTAYEATAPAAAREEE